MRTSLWWVLAGGNSPKSGQFPLLLASLEIVLKPDNFRSRDRRLPHLAIGKSAIFESGFESGENAGQQSEQLAGRQSGCLPGQQLGSESGQRYSHHHGHPNEQLR